jgi:DNA mismatch repair protein MutS
LHGWMCIVGHPCNNIVGKYIVGAFARLAQRFHFTRPNVNDTMDLVIQGGRHPVVESVSRKDFRHEFNPNDCIMREGKNLWLVTVTLL